MDKPIIWITGPPGSGKTTLVESYLDSRKLPCLWYQVDESDADIASFFYYVGIAAKHVSSKRRKPLPLLTPEYLMGIRTFTLRFFEDLYSRLKTPFVIVFDNYQEVPENSPFQEIIKAGLSNIPKGITIIIISRNQPAHTFARMGANRLMEVIGWDEMRLQIEEAKGIVRLIKRKRIPDQVVEQIYEKADGWAAGLIVIAERIGTENIEALFHGDLTPQEIFDYFAGEILDKSETEDQTFLMKTSIFPRFTTNMAKELTQNIQASRILSELSRKNYFVQRHASQKQVYQYHNLFREFLINRARETLRAEELSILRHTAAGMCETEGMIEDAVRLFIEEGVWGEVIRLILQHAPAIATQGRGLTLSGWIETVPEQIVQQTPWLLYWRGICLMPASPSQSRSLLEKAFTIFETQHDPVGAFLAWSDIVQTFFHEWDDFKPLDPWIEWLDKRMLEKMPALPLDIHARVVVYMLAALIHRKPDHPDIQIWVEQALSLSQKQPNIDLRMLAYFIVFLYFYWIGEHAQLVLLIREAAEIARLPGASPFALLLWKRVEIEYKWLMASDKSGSSHLYEALHISQTTGVHGLDFLLYSYGVSGFLSDGKLSQAAELLNKMELSINTVRRNSVGRYHLLAGWHALLVGDLPRAAVHAEKGLQLAVETGVPYGEALTRVQMAHVLCLMGRYRDAHDHLRIARDISSRMRSSLFEWMCLLADAYLAMSKGEEASVIPYLKKAMAIGRDKGYSYYEGFLPSVMTQLCLKALDNGIEVEYAQGLIRKRRLIPEQPPYDCENWPWHLKLFTLGGFEIIKEGVVLNYPAKAPRVQLNFLKAIIAIGPQGVNEERLVDMFWPETEGDASHSAFSTTLYRLRNLLGEDAVRLRDGRVLLDTRYCYVDAYAFEHLLGKADFLWERNQGPADFEEAARLTEKALALYQGSFLSDDSGDHWALSRREKLRSMFLRSIKRLADCHERDGKREKAAECYRKGLEVDDLAEELYRGLMNFYLSASRRSEALSVYDRCRKVLSTVLGIEPSQATEAIYRNIKAK